MATISFLLILLVSIFFIPSLTIFDRAPFQPECRQHIILFLLSNKNIGAQSAVKTPNAIFLFFVIRPSP